MLRMAEINYIKDLYENEGLSLREIAKTTKKNFRTVQKYAYKKNWNETTEPKASSGEYPILGEYISVIDEWIETDKREPRKQRHTIMRIYHRLQKEHGYTGSYGSVRRYVSRKKEEDKKSKESFLPLSHPPGNAQVDFGDFKYYNAHGEGCEGHALIVSLPYSNTGWMQVFPSENQECLLEGLKRVFYHMGGVPMRIKYDNMSTAVAQVLKGSERVIADGFYRFMLHYRFKAEFCNPGKGNEKGSVENKVGYTRRNMLVPVPVITDFDAFNAELLKHCDADMNENITNAAYQ